MVTNLTLPRWFIISIPSQTILGGPKVWHHIPTINGQMRKRCLCLQIMNEWQVIGEYYSWGCGITGHHLDYGKYHKGIPKACHMMPWQRWKRQREDFYIRILWMEKMTIWHFTMILASSHFHRQYLCRQWHLWATCQITGGSHLQVYAHQLLWGINSCCNSRQPWP